MGRATTTSMVQSEAAVIGIMLADANGWDPTPFSAIEDVLPVRFESRMWGDWAGLSGVVVIGSSREPGGELAALPHLLFDLGGGEAERRRSEIVFTHSTSLPQPFRGRRFIESLSPPPIAVRPSDEVLGAERRTSHLVTSSRSGRRCLCHVASSRAAGGVRSAARSLP